MGKVNPFVIIRVHILPEQCHLPSPRLNERRYFLKNLFRTPTFFPPPHKRDNAKGAILVTSLNNRHKIRDAVKSNAFQRGETKVIPILKANFSQTGSGLSNFCDIVGY